MNKCCAVLLNMGGPEKLSDVRQYLYNIFSDREIIKLPGGPLFQKLFARIISRLRTKSVQHNYSLIGGGSPLLKWTKIQAKLIEEIINKSSPDFKCYVGMRYFYPLIEETIGQLNQDGFKHIIFLPLYPQYCRATTGSTFSEIKRVLKNHKELSADYIDSFYDNPDYIDLLREYISSNIQEKSRLLFSAHSVPQNFVDEGDPYVEQVKKTAQLAAGEREYCLSFQSRTGPVKWVGPDTIEESKRLLEENTTSPLLVVPLSFVSDHIETLFEIDIDLKEKVGTENSDRIHRIPMFNDAPGFALILANLIQSRMDNHG
jgi:protoporphyrin/coproporphyrin ferrochelatase